VGSQSQPSGQTASPREQWGTRAGFILATLGSAIGLGNVWRFSYVAGENGGGAFLLVYLAAVVLVGLPLLLAELALGRHAQGDVVRAFEVAAPRHPIRFVGHFAVFGSSLILSYYAVVAGWTLRYLLDYAIALVGALPAEDAVARFGRFIAHPVEPVVWQLVFLALTAAVVIAGIRRGIEAANRIILPLLGVIVLALAGYSISLPGGGGGVRFLLAPEWSALAEPRMYLAALGQAFFSIGLGMGVLTTYGGYLGRQHRLPTAAVAIAGGDALFAVAAGLAIFPAVFAFGLEPAQGPVLAFVVLPQVFASMSGGALFGAAFFLLLAAAALTSAISLLEVPVAYAVRRFDLSRRRATLLVASAIFFAGVASALGYGPLSEVQVFGRAVLDAVDQFVSDFVLPVGGLAIAVLVGWLWGKQTALQSSDRETGIVAAAWLWTLRLIVPAVILAILLRSAGIL
jgi:neurotransmitter:Na+ symporter, NSS family